MLTRNSPSLLSSRLFMSMEEGDGIVSILKRFHNINAFEINTHSYTVSIMEHLVVAAQ